MNTLLLQQYIDQFFGYGSFDSPIWLIGIEEGGGREKKEIEKRVESWAHFKHKELLDNYEHHKKIGALDLFEEQNGKKVKIQPTWNKLIRLLISINNENSSVSTESVRLFQQKHLGRSCSDHALLEIFPLASPSNQKWNYATWYPQIEFLQSREAYQNEVDKKRIAFLSDKINQYKPKVVVCYSTGMKKYWQMLVGNESIERCYSMEKYTARFCYKADTLFVLCPHPGYMRRNAHWHSLGEEIRRNIVEI